MGGPGRSFGVLFRHFLKSFLDNDARAGGLSFEPEYRGTQALDIQP